MDIFNKFIVEDGCIIMCKVTYHKELVTDKELVRGGGSFMFTDDNKGIKFYGSSYDFGAPYLEDIQKAFKECKVYWSQYSDEDISTEYKYVFVDECGEITELN